MELEWILALAGIFLATAGGSRTSLRFETELAKLKGPPKGGFLIPESPIWLSICSASQSPMTFLAQPRGRPWNLRVGLQR